MFCACRLLSKYLGKKEDFVRQMFTLDTWKPLSKNLKRELYANVVKRQLSVTKCYDK